MLQHINGADLFLSFSLPGGMPLLIVAVAIALVVVVLMLRRNSNQDGRVEEAPAAPTAPAATAATAANNEEQDAIFAVLISAVSEELRLPLEHFKVTEIREVA